MSHDHEHDAPTQTEQDCIATLRELDVFLDGELSDEQCAEVRFHLEGCIDCFGAFDFHAELKQVIAAKCRDDELPADLVSRIEACFGAETAGEALSSEARPGETVSPEPPAAG